MLKSKLKFISTKKPNSYISKQLQRNKKKRNIRVPALSKKPQRKASCIKIFTTTPRKPNSALRKVAKIKYKNVVKFQSTIKYTFAFIPS